MKKTLTPSNWINSSTLTFSAIIIIVWALFYSYAFDSKISLNGDNASYFLLGKSLNSNHGYSLFNDANHSKHNHFPPGYPVILAIIMFISKSPLFLKVANGLFLLGSLLLSFRIFTKLHDNKFVAFTSVCFLAINYHLLRSSVMMMSEIPFLFFSLLGLLLLLRVDFTTNFLKTKDFYLFLLCISFAFHIRTIGVALFAGILFFLLLEKHWKGFFAFFTGFVLLALPWILRGKYYGLKSSYQNQLFKVNPYRPEMGDAGFIDFIERISNNFSRYVTKEIQSGYLPFIETNYKETVAIDWILGIILIALTIFGIFKLPRYKSLIIGYLSGTFVILLLWVDVWRGTRFIQPLLPILIFLTTVSLSFILDKLLGLLSLNFTFSPLYLLIFGLLFSKPFRYSGDQRIQHYPIERLSIESQNPYPPNWQNYIKIAEYSKKNIERSAIIACRKPQLFHVFSDRLSSLYPFEKDSKKTY